MRPARRLVFVFLLFVVASGCTSRCGGRPQSWLSAAETIAPGIELFRSTDTTLVDPAGPIAVSMLKLDPARVRLDSALSQDDVMGAERVDVIAARRNAVVAVNGGFFNVKNGEPVGLLKVAGELVSDAEITKGVVAIRSPVKGRTELDFDQVGVRVTLGFNAGDREWTVPIDGVDTTRERGKLMVYTPSYFGDTDTAPGGIEWTVSGQPRRIGEVRVDLGHTVIPRDGVVLSYGGLELPEALALLAPGLAVTLTRTWSTVHGLSPDRLESADHIVAGAGLIKLRGRTLDNWQARERLNPKAFLEMRHPRTVIGVDDQGFIWLLAIDGRRPDYSVGMTFAELAGLCDRLKLRDALNLDGGGSTTMVVKGAIINRPTDTTGPRAVSDAIVVTLR